MTSSLLYISSRCPTGRFALDEIRTIEETAQIRNRELDVTGVLLATRTRFAQFIEGDIDALDMLMARIRADRRHRDVRVVDTIRFETRLFPEWRMACFRPSQFDTEYVSPLLERHHGGLPPIEAAELVSFMQLIVTHDGRDRSGWRDVGRS